MLIGSQYEVAIASVRLLLLTQVNFTCPLFSPIKKLLQSRTSPIKDFSNQGTYATPIVYFPFLEPVFA